MKRHNPHIPIGNQLGKWRGLSGTTEGKSGPVKVIMQSGKVLMPQAFKRITSPKRSAESHVTAFAPLGSGGIPTAVPSAPSSEWLAVPIQPDPCRKDSVRPENDPPNVTRVETGRPHHGIS